MSVGLILEEMPKDCVRCKFARWSVPDEKWVCIAKEEYGEPPWEIYDYDEALESPEPGPNPDWCPLQEVEPVTHGKWKYDRDGLFICTVCGNEERVAQKIGVPIWGYCPWCGAKMEGEEYD